MAENPQGSIIQQDMLAEEFKSSPPKKGKSLKLAAVVAVLIIIVIVIAAYPAVYHSISKTSSNYGTGNNAANRSTIETTTAISTTVPVSVVTTTVPVSSGPIAPTRAGPTASNTTTIAQVTSTIPQSVGQCPCPSESGIASMLNVSSAGQFNATFTSKYLSSNTERIVLQAQSSNGLSQPELDGIQGGWISSYYTIVRPGSTSFTTFSEHIVNTTTPSALSATLSSLIETHNTTLSSGSAGSMDYSYSANVMAESRSIALVGYSGNYVIDLAVVVPVNSSTISVGAIAQNISASLG